MDFCSEKMIENYLLYKNPLYAFRFPIALLFGIFFYGYMEMKKWSTNSYINQLLIPIASILVVMVLLDMIARMMISKEEKKRLMLLCKMFKNRPIMKMMKNMSHMDLSMIENYQGELEIEGFENESDSMDESKESKEMPDTTEQKDDKKQKDEEKEKENKETFANHVMSNSSTVRPQIGAPMGYFENQEFVDFSNNALAYHVEPQHLNSKPVMNSKCIQNSDCCNLCSGMGDNPCNIVAPVPGPQWLPQTAAAKQNELKNNQYSSSLCPINK